MSGAADPLLTIDVAHPPRHPSTVEEDLTAAVAEVHRSASLRILKIVHGYGSTGRGGNTRTVVLNWLYRQRSRVKGVVDGTSYGLLDPVTAEMRRSVGQYADADLDQQNAGITIVWVK